MACTDSVHGRSHHLTAQTNQFLGRTGTDSFFTQEPFLCVSDQSIYSIATVSVNLTVNFKTGPMPLSLGTSTLLLGLLYFLGHPRRGHAVSHLPRDKWRMFVQKFTETRIAPETAGNTEKTSVLKVSVFKALTFRDLTSFVVFLGFLKRSAKEFTRWSEMSLSTTQSSSASTNLLVMSQSSVCPRRWVGTLTSCCKLRLQIVLQFFVFVFLFVCLFFQGSNGNTRVRVKTRNLCRQEQKVCRKRRTTQVDLGTRQTRYILLDSLFFLLGGGGKHWRMSLTGLGSRGAFHTPRTIWKPSPLLTFNTIHQTVSEQHS